MRRRQPINSPSLLYNDVMSADSTSATNSAGNTNDAATTTIEPICLQVPGNLSTTEASLPMMPPTASSMTIDTESPFFSEDLLQNDPRTTDHTDNAATTTIDPICPQMRENLSPAEASIPTKQSTDSNEILNTESPFFTGKLLQNDQTASGFTKNAATTTIEPICVQVPGNRSPTDANMQRTRSTASNVTLDIESSFFTGNLLQNDQTASGDANNAATTNIEPICLQVPGNHSPTNAIMSSIPQRAHDTLMPLGIDPSTENFMPNIDTMLSPTPLSSNARQNARRLASITLSDEGGKRQRAEALLHHIRATYCCRECTIRGTNKPKSLVLDQAQNKRRFKCTGCNKSYGCSSFLNAFEHLLSPTGLPTVYATPATPHGPCATRVNPQISVAQNTSSNSGPVTPQETPRRESRMNSRTINDSSTMQQADDASSLFMGTPMLDAVQPAMAPTPSAPPRLSRVVSGQPTSPTSACDNVGTTLATFRNQIGQSSLFRVPKLQTTCLGPDGFAAALIPPTKAEMLALRGGRESVLDDVFNERNIEQGRRKRIRKALKVLHGPPVPKPAEMVRVGVEMAQRNIGMMLSALQQVGFNTNLILHAMATSSGAELVIPSSYAPAFVDRAHAFGITLTQPMAAKPATPDGRRTLLKRLEVAAIKAGHANTRAFFAQWAAQVRQVASDKPTIDLGNNARIERSQPPVEQAPMATTLSTVDLGCIGIEDNMADMNGQIADTSGINADEQYIGVDSQVEPPLPETTTVQRLTIHELDTTDGQWLHIIYLNVCGLSTDKLDTMSSRLQPNSICFLAESWHIDEARRMGHPNMVATSLEVNRSLVSRGKGGLHAIAHTALKSQIRIVERAEHHIPSLMATW